MKKYSWSYNKNESIYTKSADTIEKCIEDALIDSEGQFKSIYIGENRNTNNDSVLKKSIEQAIITFIDCISEDLSDQVGEIAEDWRNNLSTTDILNLGERLLPEIKKFLKETKNEISYYKVVNVKEFTL